MPSLKLFCGNINCRQGPKVACDRLSWHLFWTLLYDDKTEILLIVTQKQLSKVPINRIKVGEADVAPVTTARYLGT